MSVHLTRDVMVAVNCPNCGSEDYEVDFSAEDIAAAATVSLPCDECDMRIAVYVNVEVSSEAQA